MSSLYERNGAWQIQFVDTERQPPRRRFSLGTRDARTAGRLQARADLLYESGAWDPWRTPLKEALHPERKATTAPATPDLRQIRDRFVARPELAASTRRTYAQIIDLFLGAVGAAEVGTAQFDRLVMEWLDSGTEGRKATYARHVRYFESWAKENQLIAESLRITPKTKAKNRKPLVYFEPEEIDAIVAAVERENPSEAVWMAPVIRVCVYTGLRLREVTGARTSWYDAPQQRLILPGDATKSRKDDQLFVPNEAVTVIEMLVERSRSGHLFEHRGRKLNPGTLSNRFRYWRKRAGIEAGNFHTLRHTCASWLAKGGAPLNVIQRHMRHADISTTMRYVHLSPTSLAAQVSAAFER